MRISGKDHRQRERGLGEQRPQRAVVGRTGHRDMQRVLHAPRPRHAAPPRVWACCATSVTAAAAGAAVKVPRAWTTSAGFWLAAARVNWPGRGGAFGGIGTAARRTGLVSTGFGRATAGAA